MLLRSNCTVGFSQTRSSLKVSQPCGLKNDLLCSKPLWACSHLENRDASRSGIAHCVRWVAQLQQQPSLSHLFRWWQARIWLDFQKPSLSHLFRWARSTGLETLSLESLTRFGDAVPGVADSLVEFPLLRAASLYPGGEATTSSLPSSHERKPTATPDSDFTTNLSWCVTGAPTCVRRGALRGLRLHSFFESSRDAAPLWKPFLCWAGCAFTRGQAFGQSLNPTSPWTEYLEQRGLKETQYARGTHTQGHRWSRWRRSVCHQAAQTGLLAPPSQALDRTRTIRKRPHRRDHSVLRTLRLCTPCEHNCFPWKTATRDTGQKRWTKTAGVPLRPPSHDPCLLLAARCSFPAVTAKDPWRGVRLPAYAVSVLASYRGALLLWEMGFVFIRHSAVEHRRVFTGWES